MYYVKYNTGSSYKNMHSAHLFTLNEYILLFLYELWNDIWTNTLLLLNYLQNRRCGHGEWGPLTCPFCALKLLTNSMLSYRKQKICHRIWSYWHIEDLKIWYSAVSLSGTKVVHHGWVTQKLLDRKSTDCWVPHLHFYNCDFILI